MNGISFNKACCLEIFRCMFVRILLVVHGGLAVHFLITFNSLRNEYYALTAPLILLALEGIVMTALQTSFDVNRFWPICACLYLSSVLPIIWITELEVKNMNKTIHNSSKISNRNISRTQTDDPFESLRDFFGINEGIIEKWCKVGMFIVLIAGRWIISLGNSSRDELTSLLLALVGHAPDSMDLLTPLNSKPLENANEIIFDKTTDIFRICIVLVVYSFSVIQFAIRTPDIQEKKNQKQIKMTNVSKLVNSKMKNLSTGFKRAKVSPFSLVENNNKSIISLDKNGSHIDPIEQTKKEESHFSRNSGSFQRIVGLIIDIFIALCLHAGPTFVLRLVMTIRYDVMDEMHLFFLVKNGVEIIVLLHRFYLVHKLKKSQLKDENQLDDAEKEVDEGCSS